MSRECEFCQDADTRRREAEAALAAAEAKLADERKHADAMFVACGACISLNEYDPDTKEPVPPNAISWSKKYAHDPAWKVLREAYEAHAARRNTEKEER